MAINTATSRLLQMFSIMPDYLSFLDIDTTRALGLTCRYANDWFARESLQQRFLKAHYGVSADTAPFYSEMYERHTYAHSNCPDVFCDPNFAPGIVAREFLVTPDGKKVITETLDLQTGTIISLDCYAMDTGVRIWSTTDVEGAIGDLQISSDGTTLYVAYEMDFKYYLSRIEIESNIVAQMCEVDFFLLMQPSADGQCVYCGSFNKDVKRFHLETGQCDTFPAPEKFLNDVGINNRILAFYQNGTKAISSMSRKLIFWDVHSGTILCETEEMHRYTNHLVHLVVQVSADQTKALSFYDKDEIKVWDLTTGKCIQHFLMSELCKTRPDQITNIHATRDLKRAVLACDLGSQVDNSEIVLIDLEKGKHITTFNTHDNGTPYVKIKSDGTGIIVNTTSKIKAYKLDGLPKERLSRLAQFFRSNPTLARANEQVFLLPQFVQEAIGGCSEKIERYNDTQVILPKIFHLLLKAQRQPKEAPVLVSKAYHEINSLSMRAKEILRRHFLQIRSSHGKSLDEELNDPEWFKDESLIEDGIKTVLRTRMELKDLSKPEGKQD